MARRTVLEILPLVAGQTNLQKRRPIKFSAPESHEIGGKMQISIAFFEYVPTRYNIARQSADQIYRGAIV